MEVIPPIINKFVSRTRRLHRTINSIEMENDLSLLRRFMSKKLPL